MKQQTLVLILILMIGCSQDNSFKDVGDIPFDASVDTTDFEICNERSIKQYYVRRSSDEAPRYKGEKAALDSTIISHYSYPLVDRAKGYITIRFIVNCKGETGRFRVEEMDFNYKPFDFNNKLSNQLLNIVKNLDGWIPRKSRGKNKDFYQYLTFKIRDGQIVKILP